MPQKQLGRSLLQLTKPWKISSLMLYYYLATLTVVCLLFLLNVEKSPIFHMEAGNRCFDFRVPEEINRRIVDHTSDINLTYSEIARDYLLREGLPPDQVIKNW